MGVIRILFLGAFAFATVSIFLVVTEYNKSVFFIEEAMAKDSSDYVATTVVDEYCMPASMSTKYYKIPTPKNFCSCINDGLKEEEAIIKSGNTMESFFQMCADVSYNKINNKTCNHINGLLENSGGSKARLDCECFSKKVKFAALSAVDFKEKPNFKKQGFSALFENSKPLGKTGPDQETVVLSASVMSSCMK